MPPPDNKIGAEASMAAITAGSELKAAVNAPIGPSEGFVAQTIAHGSKPRSKKTAIKRPQSKNHLRAFCAMVDKTSALIIALSMEDIVSNKISPETTSTIDKISIYD